MTTLTFTSLFTNEKLTRSAFITELRTRIYEDTADTTTDVQLHTFIKQGNYDICFRTKLLPEYATATLDASASYTLPEDMVEILNWRYRLLCKKWPADRSVWVCTYNRYF